MSLLLVKIDSEQQEDGRNILAVQENHFYRLWKTQLLLFLLFHLLSSDIQVD